MITLLDLGRDINELNMANPCLVLHYLMNVYTEFHLVDDGKNNMILVATCTSCSSPNCGGSHIHRQRTCYTRSFWDNIVRLCDECRKDNDAYWDDMWLNVEGH